MPPRKTSACYRFLSRGICKISPFFLLLLSLAACSTTNRRLPLPKPPANGATAPTPLPSAASHQLTPQEAAFWDALAQANVIYISEVHSDNSHHEYQFDVMRGLRSRDLRFATGWEMFEVPQQELLDQWQTGALSTDALLERVEWQKHWGVFSQLYEKMLRWAREEQVPVIALNAPSALSSKVAHGQALDASERTLIPAGFHLIPGGFEHFAEQMAQNPHAGVAGSARLQNFYRAQTLWEQTMASRVVEYLRNHPGGRLVVLIGRGHVEGGYGVPAYVRQKMNVKQLVLYPGESNSSGDGGRLAREAKPNLLMAHLTAAPRR